MVPIELLEELTSALADYGTVPIAFTVESRYRIEVADKGLGGWVIAEEEVQRPYIQDYDQDKGEGPTRWPRRWDISNWVITSAFDDKVRLGGAVVAWNTPGLYMLEGRTDLACLWDVRVHPDHRREGVGSLLFQHSAEWARSKGCRQLKIETQNINVPACRFYAEQGCELRAMHPGAYSESPDEIQMLWYLDL